MSFYRSRQIADKAAQAARANDDEATALLAEALAELAKSVDAELRNLKSDIDDVKRRVR